MKVLLRSILTPFLECGYKQQQYSSNWKAFQTMYTVITIEYNYHQLLSSCVDMFPLIAAVLCNTESDSLFVQWCWITVSTFHWFSVPIITWQFQVNFSLTRDNLFSVTPMNTHPHEQTVTVRGGFFGMSKYWEGETLGWWGTLQNYSSALWVHGAFHITSFPKQT